MKRSRLIILIISVMVTNTFTSCDRYFIAEYYVKNNSAGDIIVIRDSWVSNGKDTFLINPSRDTIIYNITDYGMADDYANNTKTTPFDISVTNSSGKHSLQELRNIKHWKITLSDSKTNQVTYEATLTDIDFK